MSREPTPAERQAAWEREDPAELFRAAAEWRALGETEYADWLEVWARGERPSELIWRPSCQLSTR